MRTQTFAGAKRPRAEPTPKAKAAVVATMVLKMLGSAAAVFGGGGGTGGHSSSRALIVASASTSALSSTRSLFGFRGGVGSGSRSASSSSSGAFVGRLPLLAGRTHHQQQHKRCSSWVQQRRDRGRPNAALALMPSSGDPTGGLWGTLRSTSTSTSGSSGLPQHRLVSSPSHRRLSDGGSPRLMSTATGEGGEGKGFWTDDEGFEEPPSTFRDSKSTASTSATSGGYDASWETPPPADAAEAGFVQEEDDEAGWMAGQDVDPEAEAIFFGDKVPFAELGLSPALCGHLDALGIGHSTAVQVGGCGCGCGCGCSCSWEWV